MQNLFETLEAKGLQVYSRKPLYILKESIIEVTIGEDVEIIENSGDYGGNSLRLTSEKGTIYVPLRRNADLEKTTFTVSSYVAQRDSEEYGVVAGSIKIFAE